MSAFVRYALLKSRRDDFLLPIVLGPVVLLGAPMIGLMVRTLILRHHAFPVEIPGSTGAHSLMLPYFAAVLASGAAGAASFWLFRDEIAHQSLAAFLMAVHPGRIVGAAILYGTVCAAASFAATYAVLTVMFERGLPFLIPLLCTVAGSVVAGAIGIAIVTRYSDPGLTLPVVIVSILAAGILVSTRDSTATLAVMTAIAALSAVSASLLMERRCAG